MFWGCPFHRASSTKCDTHLLRLLFVNPLVRLNPNILLVHQSPSLLHTLVLAVKETVKEVVVNAVVKMKTAEPAYANLTQLGRNCGKVRHWTIAHNPDGTLNPGTPSFDPKGTSILPMKIKQILQAETIKTVKIIMVDLVNKQSHLSYSHKMLRIQKIN